MESGIRLELAGPLAQGSGCLVGREIGNLTRGGGGGGGVVVRVL